MEESNIVERLFIKGPTTRQIVNAHESKLSFELTFGKLKRTLLVNVAAVPLDANVPSTLPCRRLKAFLKQPPGIKPLCNYISPLQFSHLLKFTPSNLPVLLAHSNQIARSGQFIVVHCEAQISNCDICGGYTKVNNKKNLLFHTCCAEREKKEALEGKKEIWGQTRFSFLDYELPGSSRTAGAIQKEQIKLEKSTSTHPQTYRLARLNVKVGESSFSQLQLKYATRKRVRFTGVGDKLVRIDLDKNAKIDPQAGFKIAKVVRKGPSLLVAHLTKADKKVLSTLYIYPLNEPVPLKSKHGFFRSLLKSRGHRVSRKKTIKELCVDSKIDLYHYTFSYLAGDKIGVWIDRDGVEYAVCDHHSSYYCKACKRSKKNGSACCELSREFKSLDCPDMGNYVEKTRIFFYDIETWHGDDGVHQFVLASYRLPSGKIKTVFSSVEVVDEIFNQAFLMQIEADANPTKKYELQVVGYNSSRYDDVLISKAYQRKIAAKKKLDDYSFANKGGALIFNNLKLSSNSHIKFLDVLRYIGFPCPLKEAAKSNGVETLKGLFPFRILNDKFHLGIIKYDTDGFYALEYFDFDEQLRRDTLDYYLKVTADCPEGEDIDIFFCQKYCEDDVKAGYQVYVKLIKDYTSFCHTGMLNFLYPHADEPNVSKEEKFGAYYLSEAFTKAKTKFERDINHCRPELKHAAAEARRKFSELSITNGKKLGNKKFKKNQKEPFNITRMHSLPAAAYKMQTYMALHSSHTSFSFWTGKHNKIKRRNLYITTPTSQNYNDVKEALAGGWVGSAMQGFLGSKKLLGEFTGPQPKCAESDTFKTTKQDLFMVDVVSQYPTSNTGPQYAGIPVTLEEEESLLEIVNLIYTAESLEEIPPVLLTCQLETPEKKYMHLTCPPLRKPNGGLAWSYEKDLASKQAVYSAVDLWTACTYLPNYCKDKNAAGWRIVNPTRALVYSENVPMYRPFVEYARKLKQEGEEEGDKCKRTIGKGLLNSGIGSMGKKVEKRNSIYGKKDMRTHLQKHGRYTTLIDASENKQIGDTEFVFKTTDARDNDTPNHHAVTMYAYSRLIIRDVIAQTGVLEKELGDQAIPTPAYGDTDSAIITRKGFQNIDDCHKGKEVGLYNLDTCMLDYNIGAEDVHKEGFEFFCLIVLARKFYALITYNPTTKKFLSKIKSKGHKVWRAGDPCVHHQTTNCFKCKCAHGYIYMCEFCIFSSLDEVYTRPPEASMTKLTLWEMVRCSLTGIPGRVEQMRFTRNLELPSLDMSSFTIRTTNQAIQVGFALIPGEKRGFYYYPKGGLNELQ